MTTHEKCWLCSFWNGDRCTNTWRLVVYVEPTGGQVDFACTPGMVPEELKPKLTEYFSKFITKLLPVIETMSVWDEIREFQLAHFDTQACPGRKENKELKPYLRIVKP